MKLFVLIMFHNHATQKKLFHRVLMCGSSDFDDLSAILAPFYYVMWSSGGPWSEFRPRLPRFRRPLGRLLG